MMSKRTKTILVVSVLLFLSSAVLCLGLWYFTVSAGEELRGQAATVAAFRAEEQAVGNLARLVEDTALERGELLSYVLVKDDVPTFITKLEGYASEQGVLVETSNLRERDGEVFNELLLTLEMSGSKKALVQFYQILESLPYHSYVSSLSLTRVFNANTGAATWESSVELTVTLTGL